MHMPSKDLGTCRLVLLNVRKTTDRCTRCMQVAANNLQDRSRKCFPASMPHASQALRMYGLQSGLAEPSTRAAVSRLLGIWKQKAPRKIKA